MLPIRASIILSWLSVGVLRTSAVALPIDPAVLAAEGVDEPKPVAQPFAQAARPASQATTFDRAGWTATADSAQPGFPASNVLDGDTGTFWHTKYNPDDPLPHRITIDMKTSHNINGLTYLPRQDGQFNGNIGQHIIETSTNNNNYVVVAKGTWEDDNAQKQAYFSTVAARYVRITANTEAGGRGTWTSAAEINVLAAATGPAAPAGKGQWSPTINFPIVPVSGAIQHDSGKLLTWSSYAPDVFTGNNGGQTFTSTYDPATGIVSQRIVTNTGHDMFCPGISMAFDGRIIVTGGNNAEKTSIYSPNADAWFGAPNMQISRGYQSSATLSDGRIFVIGGSWSGGQGGKNGEIYNPTANTWTLLPGCPVAPMLTADSQGIFRQDNHGWLFGWKNGYVFQAGPAKNMNWYGTTGTGSQRGAGTRAADTDSMDGNAVMYDAVAGKILTLGGSPDYQSSQATANAHIITIGAPNTNPTVVQINPMYAARAFGNAVVLPDGKVFIVGGQTYAQPFSDDTAILIPELWDPATTRFIQLAPQAVARVYHSIALLLGDGTVFSGGSGLCGDCDTNHFDGQIYSPPYLFQADGVTRAARPVITGTSATVFKYGSTFTATTNGGVATFSLIRYGTNTHTVDTDQRRIPLPPAGNNGNTYTLRLPNDPGVLLPGFYWLWAINGAGVPSVGTTVRVTL